MCHKLDAQAAGTQRMEPPDLVEEWVVAVEVEVRPRFQGSGHCLISPPGSHNTALGDGCPATMQNTGLKSHGQDIG